MLELLIVSLAGMNASNWIRKRYEILDLLLKYTSETDNSIEPGHSLETIRELALIDPTVATYIKYYDDLPRTTYIDWQTTMERLAVRLVKEKIMLLSKITESSDGL